MTSRHIFENAIRQRYSPKFQQFLTRMAAFKSSLVTNPPLWLCRSAGVMAVADEPQPARSRRRATVGCGGGSYGRAMSLRHAILWDARRRLAAWIRDSCLSAFRFPEFSVRCRASSDWSDWLDNGVSYRAKSAFVSSRIIYRHGTRISTMAVENRIPNPSEIAIGMIY